MTLKASLKLFLYYSSIYVHFLTLSNHGNAQLLLVSAEPSTATSTTSKSTSVEKEQVCRADDQTCNNNDVIRQESKKNTDGDFDFYGYGPDDEIDDDYEEEEEEEEEEDKAKQKLSSSCEDTHTMCSFWASEGECDSNPNYMLEGCPSSCGQCSKEVLGLGAKYGEAQQCEGSSKEECIQYIHEMEKYMETVIRPDPKLSNLITKCQVRHHLCGFWAAIGECENNPKYMQIHCAPVCKSCEMLDFDRRCPLDPNAVDAIGPGDLDEIFERIVDGVDKDKYNTTVLSRPTHPVVGKDDDDISTDYILGPWVITVDDFVEKEECERLIELGGIQGFKRSTDVGAEEFDGTHGAVESLHRTSHNAWCQDECFDDPMSQKVIRKIEKLTGVPDTNSEHLQLLKYEVGEYYKQHHDYIEVDRERPAGPRILTAYLYLNDVEEGGGTRFPKLGGGLTVMPKRGRLLLWPSILNERPKDKDFRTDHEALPVEKGIKYGANGWIHLRDFKTNNKNGCT